MFCGMPSCVSKDMWYEVNKENIENKLKIIKLEEEKKKLNEYMKTLGAALKDAESIIRKYEKEEFSDSY